MSEFLKVNHSLTDLDMSFILFYFFLKSLLMFFQGGSCGPEGAEYIFESLKTNSTLLKLEMSKNSFRSLMHFHLFPFLFFLGDCRSWDSPMKALPEALEINKTLTYLGMCLRWRNFS